MPQQLVNHVRLGRVHGLRMVPNVLGRKEDPESQRSQEIPRRQEPRYRPQGEPRLLLQMVRDVLELGDPLPGINPGLLHLLQSGQLLPARPARVQGGELVPDVGPSAVLLRSVGHLWDEAPSAKTAGVVANDRAALPVGWVVESRVVALEVCPCVQGGPGELVYVLHLAREPRHRRLGELKNFVDLRLQLPQHLHGAGPLPAALKMDLKQVEVRGQRGHLVLQGGQVHRIFFEDL
mmetsp:Transcript_3857/g.7878  ORF Transcript_3857/g.7878 Transcript_3857/m.7878 type:complete len:235 (+) Transcript_3857:573-1277(+)